MISLTYETTPPRSNASAFLVRFIAIPYEEDAMALIVDCSVAVCYCEVLRQLLPDTAAVLLKTVGNICEHIAFLGEAARPTHSKRASSAPEFVHSYN